MTDKDIFLKNPKDEVLLKQSERSKPSDNKPQQPCWWSFNQLVDWYRGKMVLVKPDLYWGTREQEYEKYTRAFHIGLKILEHWDRRWNPFVNNTWETSDIYENYMSKGMAPLKALLEYTEWRHKQFQTYEVSPSRTASVQDQRTFKLILEYKKEYTDESNFNSLMSEAGKTVLKEIYYFITEELERGDSRFALKKALIGSADIFGGSKSLFISESELLN